MKPLPMRFKKETSNEIKEAADFGHHEISKSAAARAAMNLGLELLKGARESMSYDEYAIFIMNNQ